MAMIHKKDKPTYYNLVTEGGAVIDTVAKSKVYVRKAALEKELGEKLKIVLVIEENNLK